MKKFRITKILMVSLLLMACIGMQSVFAGGDSEEEVAGVEKQVLEVAVFEGGYGVEWVYETARRLEARHPGLTVEVEVGSRLWEKMQPRFVAGNPPDVVAPGWLFDHWAAITEGQFSPLDEYLNTKADDSNTPWVDTFLPGTFSVGAYDGKTWYLPLFYSTYGWWYNKSEWDRNGWEAPKTWDEAYKVFDKMKAAGVGPIANQAKYPMYLTYPYLTEFMARLAGPEKLEACFNLEPNSWTDPEIVEAFDFLDNLIENYFQEGHLGMNHTQSQAEVMVGSAGLIACGSWFPKEMEAVWPEGDEIRAMPLPSFPDSPYPQNVYNKDGDSALLFVIPTAAKNKELAAEFLKLMTSEEMTKFIVENTGNPTTNANALKYLPDNKFGDAMKSVLAFYEGAEYTIGKREALEMWYPKLEKELQVQLSLLQEKGIGDAAKYAAAMQAIADETRNDPNVLKHEFSLD